MTTFQSIVPTRSVQENPTTTKIHVVEYCVVTEAVLARLRSSPYYALRSLTGFCRCGELQLDGIVPSYYMKQMAQETIRTIDGVEVIVNRVIVRE